LHRLLPHVQSTPDDASTFSSWSLAARHYRIHYAANMVVVVPRTTAPIQMPSGPATSARPATPTGSSRNPIEVSSVSPKKKRKAIKVNYAPVKKGRVGKTASARTRINKSLKRPSPTPSSPSPPRQRRRRHLPQQSGSPPATNGIPIGNTAITSAASSEPIEISSDSDLSNSEVPVVTRGRGGGLPSVLTPVPMDDASSESEAELPAPAFMFRTLAGASPDDMYDSDSPSEAIPLIAVTLPPALQLSPYVPASGLVRTLAGASPDDMYDSDSSSAATPSIAVALVAAVNHSPGSIETADEDEERNAVDTVVGVDPTPLSTQGMQATTSPPNRGTRRDLTPAGFPLTQSTAHRQFLTPTLPRTPRGYTTPGAISRSINSPNNSPSPFAHLSQAELDSLLMDQLDSLQ